MTSLRQEFELQHHQKWEHGRTAELIDNFLDDSPCIESENKEFPEIEIQEYPVFSQSYTEYPNHMDEQSSNKTGIDLEPSN